MKRQVIFPKSHRKKSPNRTRDVILIGTDLADICTSEIYLAVNSLNKNELVIGPSKDGGYWLIGFSKDIISPYMYWPFSGINWGGDSVLEETITQAKLIHIK